MAPRITIETVSIHDLGSMFAIAASLTRHLHRSAMQILFNSALLVQPQDTADGHGLAVLVIDKGSDSDDETYVVVINNVKLGMAVVMLNPPLAVDPEGLIEVTDLGKKVTFLSYLLEWYLMPPGEEIETALFGRAVKRGLRDD